MIGSKSSSSWFAYFSACWSSSSKYCCVLDDTAVANAKQQTTVVTNSHTKSSCSTTTTTSSSSSVNMVVHNSSKQRRRSKGSHHLRKSTVPSNQLLKQVSPYEELPISDERYPFDEGLVGTRGDPVTEEEERHENVLEREGTRPRRSVLESREPTNSLSFQDHRHHVVNVETEYNIEGIPTFIFIPTEGDDETEVTLDGTLFASNGSRSEKDDDEEGELRTLTPHPSYENDKSLEPTPKDLYCLHNAPLLHADEQDWPSDEDSPQKGSKLSGGGRYSFLSEGNVHDRNLRRDIMYIMKDDISLARPTHNARKYRLV